ncbi:hypothetical protein BASA81_001990 [Batrachochytrium salamandrivorans]|nr:hypothetical protein BASA81_001990 [Batrachochytrium salamandrivorans]
MRIKPKPRRASVWALLLFGLVMAAVYLLSAAGVFYPSAPHSIIPKSTLLISQLEPATGEEKRLFAEADPLVLQNVVDELLLSSKLSLVNKASRNQHELIDRLAPESEMQRTLLLMLSRRFTQVATVANNDQVEFQNRVLGRLTPSQQAKLAGNMGMDTHNLWQPIPVDILRKLELNGQNPLNSNCTTGNALHVADHGGKYGGFTADIGWVLMNAMYALETGNCIEFSEQWGHGCDEEGREAGWTCVFKPVQPVGLALSVQQVIRMRSSDANTRRMVRRDELYTPARLERHRYPRLAELVSRADRNSPRFRFPETADLLAFRLVFRWMFQPTERVQRMVADIQKQVLQGFVPEEIAGAHLRFGDKLGLRPGPKEAHAEYQVRDFAERLVLYYKERQLAFPKALFVATDDYEACQGLARLLGDSVTVLTSASQEKDRGFSIVEYRERTSSKDRFAASVRLWADMDLLAKTQVFLGSFQSNVGRTVHLMRFDKPANSTISVDPVGARCAHRTNQLSSHNFWYCP